ncbi:glycosyltransferase [Streptomyces phyllanthi]|uniref:glycosyltransferase n=1 Tax=Streptomyces phyllanthi TaxID=1803180 RepID=UPI001883CF65|nr:glycosyltransferase [Streptomyces phyllanthi]
MTSLRIALMTHGTRGDVQPLVALGREFLSRGHSPVLAVPAGFVEFVRNAGLPAEPLPADWRGFLTDPTADRSWLTSDDSTELLAGLRTVMAAHAGGIAQTLIRLSEGADLIVSGSLTEDMATVIAEAREIPPALLHLFPVRRNGMLANPFVTGRSSAVREQNVATHEAYERASWESRREGINALRAALGLAETELPTPDRVRAIGGIELQAYSPHLVRGMDWPAHRPVVGWLDLDEHTRRAVGEYGLDPELEAWLADGPAPGYFGFGSMPVADAQAMVRTIEKATGELGLRAVVTAGWAELSQSAVSDPNRIRVVGDTHHGALLRRCRFAVHHGGAGTTGAVARAGLPSLITSVMLDQAMWGEIVQRRGAGLHLPMRAVDAGSLGTALEGILTPEIMETAEVVGHAVRSEPDAVAAAADSVLALAHD